jgi:hypothetical protein
MCNTLGYKENENQTFRFYLTPVRIYHQSLRQQQMLARMQGKRKTYPLLVGVQMERYMEFS